MINALASVSDAFIASSIISAPTTLNRFTIVSSIRSKSTASACSARFFLAASRELSFARSRDSFRVHAACSIANLIPRKTLRSVAICALSEIGEGGRLVCQPRISTPLLPRTIADVLHGVHDKQEKAARRPRPLNKRVWASIEHTPQRVIQDAFDEAMRRDPELRRRWVVLVDGNKDQLARIKRAARETGVKITIVLDIVHVLEYLWRAAHAFHSDGTKEAQAWVECRLLALLNGRSGGQIAKSLRAMIKTHSLDEKATERVEATATYLTNNTRHMHYDRALAEGLPIATGVIEGACRYLVQDRMGRTGAVWSAAGAEAVLRLRALRTSGDFDDYWQFHLAKEHERTHQSRYANGDVPNPLPPKRPHLKLVK